MNIETTIEQNPVPSAEKPVATEKPAHVEIVPPDFSRFWAGVIGQERIVSVLSRSVANYAMGGTVPSFSFSGLAGLGKTTLLMGLKDALAEVMGETQTLVVSSPEAFRLVSSTESKLVKQSLKEIRPLALFIDEFHELSTGYVGPFKKAVSRFLKEAMSEDAERGKEVKFGDEDEGSWVTGKTFGYSAATNYPQLVRDSEAMFRRFDGRLSLDLLSEENVAKITRLMLQGRHVRADEKTVGIIARCGRGTCELPSRIAKELEKVARVGGKSSVNRAEVLQALKDLEKFPRGLSVAEVRILSKAQGFTRPASLALALGVEKKEVDKAITFLLSQETEGKQTPFLDELGSKVRVNVKGLKYISDIKADGFRF